MNSLSLKTFLAAEDSDLEKNQYIVLAGLKEYRNEFKKQKLYPALTELINLVTLLKVVSRTKSDLKNSFPKQIKKFDTKSKKVVLSTLEPTQKNVEYFFDLIDWAMPKIKDLIDEAVVLYEFVEKNIKVESVGILPFYREEGYFLIPDNKGRKMQVHYFECSLFSSGKEKYRTLKTKFLQASEILLSTAPEFIKLKLIKQYREIPNPATFVCETDLDFPFLETIFPIAKRKLMTKISA
jgi:hypothetical protein